MPLRAWDALRIHVAWFLLPLPALSMEALSAPIADTRRGPLVGTKVGKYELTRLLGSGTTSSVYLARDPATARDVAVKLFSIDQSTDPEQATLRGIRRLETEAAL